LTEGVRTPERPSASLVALISEHFGADIDLDEPGWAGEESIGWRASSEHGPTFVQRFPSWRSLNEIGWCQAIARAAASTAPEAVAATTAADGTVVIESDEGPLCVFPFVNGTHPTSGQQVAAAAAEVLARIHRGLAGWTGPERLAGTTSHSRPVHEPPPILVDPDLDAWERLAADGATSKTPIHGDFYPGNLIVDGNRIAGVVDWLEADIEDPVQEVAWAAWEFCHNDAGDDLVEESAQAFLRAYSEGGGPASVEPPVDMIPWIRRRLRREASVALQSAGAGPLEDPYHVGLIRAFHALRDRRLFA
jgi:Ser/Thr protein kinase RdoA (MazF antagonist)